MLASRLGMNLSELPPIIGISYAMLFGYRKGTNRITSKVWLKLDAAEAAAGICEKKPGDVIRTGQVKDFSGPSGKNVSPPQGDYASAKEVHELRDSVADLRDQVLVLNRMVAALLHQSPPQEGATGSKKAGSVSRHRRSKVKSDNPSLSPDAWLIDRNERGGDHDD